MEIRYINLFPKEAILSKLWIINMLTNSTLAYEYFDLSLTENKIPQLIQ